MKVTYPHMGEAYIAIKGLLDDLEVENVVPAFTTYSTLKEGEKYSPETVCMPFKITLGNYLNSIQSGADAILITGSCGPCRFGYYGPLQKAILDELGLGHVEMLILDHPREGYGKFLSTIGRLSGHNYLGTLQAIKNAYGTCLALEQMNELVYRVRPRSLDKSKVHNILHNFKKDIVNIHGTQALQDHIQKTAAQLKQVERNQNTTPIRIGIIGEIYTIIEPYANLNIEEKLGDLGVEVHRSMTVKDWADNTLVRPLTGRKSYGYAKRLAKPYLPRMIGGHAQQCIGHAVHYAQQGYDGLIQIYPMTCMPEIVSRSILTQVEKDYDIPILNLIVDEHTGEAGFQTRIEAFVDYLKERQKEM